MLRRHPRESFDVTDSSAGSGPRDEGPAERTKLFSNLRADTDKRKFSGGGANYGSAAGQSLRPEQGSPQKKTRVGSGSVEQRRLGLGIQYGQ
jgi:hypothetical protein